MKMCQEFSSFVRRKHVYSNYDIMQLRPCYSFIFLNIYVTNCILTKMCQIFLSTVITTFIQKEKILTFTPLYPGPLTSFKFSKASRSVYEVVY